LEPTLSSASSRRSPRRSGSFADPHGRDWRTARECIHPPRKQPASDIPLDKLVSLLCWSQAISIRYPVFFHNTCLLSSLSHYDGETCKRLHRRYRSCAAPPSGPRARARATPSDGPGTPMPRRPCWVRMSRAFRTQTLEQAVKAPRKCWAWVGVTRTRWPHPSHL